jgi:glutaredoxin-like protein
MLPDDVKAQVKETLADLDNPVHLVLFTQTLECMYCRENRQLMEDVAELSDLVDMTVYNFVTDKEKAEEFGVDKIPATVIMGKDDYGIRFYGIPAGYEFTTLIHSIRMIGKAGSQLDEQTVQALDALTDPVHLQVFVTPTCPYCPQAVALGFEMAYASANVRADGVESSEFPHLAVKYQVAGVPRTVINENTHLEGAAPPDMLLEKIQEALAAGQDAAA